MTLNEAAAALGLSPSTLRNQVRNGQLRSRKVGRDWHVTPAAVAEYRERHQGKIGRPRVRPLTPLV